jgi:hypothetical protein
MGKCFLCGKGGTPSAELPKFTYSGEFQLVNEGNKNWKLKLLTGGKLRFTNLGTGINGIDVFCVGGGGGGGYNNNYGGGGGGGYTTTVKGLSIQPYTEYNIEIGAGGPAFTDGGDTSAFSVVAKGGKTGGSDSGGGDGGSGGGGYAGNYAAGGNGGSDGSNGTAGSTSSGIGQGTTTKEFQESSGALYAGGGGGGGQGGGGKGGSGGGGNGGSDSAAATAGATNTGGGGGGAGQLRIAGEGGSGIVILRNARG